MNEEQNKLIEKILQLLEKTEESECHCGKVYDMLDQIIELEKQGVDIAEMMPEVKHHLEVCGCCRSEYRLLSAICCDDE